MMKNNKGIALAYTLMTMLLVFAICMIIITIMLAQVAHLNTYERRAETERLYSQIGDIFYSVGGEFLGNEAPDCQSSPFAIALKNASFTIEPCKDSTDPYGDSNEWIVGSENNRKFLLSLSIVDSTKRLIIKDETDDKIYLTIRVGVINESIQIIEWTRGY